MIVYDGDRQELAKKIQEAFKKGHITEDEYIALINNVYNGGGDKLKTSRNDEKIHTLKEFRDAYEGKSWQEVAYETGVSQGMGAGPEMRYVLNPNDNNIMDMRHVSMLGYQLGVEVGKFIEAGQGIAGQLGTLIEARSVVNPVMGLLESSGVGATLRGVGISGWDPQDYYSNQIGADFRNANPLGTSDPNWAVSFYNFMTK